MLTFRLQTLKQSTVLIPTSRTVWSIVPLLTSLPGMLPIFSTWSMDIATVFVLATQSTMLITWFATKFTTKHNVTILPLKLPRVTTLAVICVSKTRKKLNG